MTTNESATTTVEEFVESMTEWANRSISRTAFHCRGNALLSREDLLQEARLTLTEVWHMYVGGWCRACKAPAPADACAGCGVLSVRIGEVTPADLRRVGAAAIFKHVGNLHYRARAAKRGRNVAALSLDDPAVTAERHLRRHGALALDRLLLRESVSQVERSLRDEDRRALLAAIDPAETRPAPALPGAGKIFNRVKKTVHLLLEKDGYLDMRAYAVRRTGQPERGEGGMETMTAVRGPEAPDAEHKVEAPKPAPERAARPAVKKKSHQGRAGGKGASKAQTAAQTRADSGAFKKDQEVTYLGGGRAGWLKAGTKLRVLGAVTSRGRTYVRCITIKTKRKVPLSSLVIKK